ncbi:tRNA-dihydrouridine synthase [Candidatus Pacearchaeota archaeon]|nr:tRNA-dihydrouridine synthase [Candidatus Pacearchaeota archaeon]
MEIQLASMENITCWAFRSLMQGVTDSYSGVMSMNYLVKRNKAWHEVDMFPINGQKQWLQVATSKEEECAAFLKKLNEKLITSQTLALGGKASRNEKLKEDPKKYDNKMVIDNPARPVRNIKGSLDALYGIQLNCSCPSPNVISIGQGPALIKRPQRVVGIINELLKQDKFKISIKTRLGLNEFEVRERRLFKLLDELEKIKDPNFTEVVVHFRHAKEKSTAEYDYSSLREICDYNIPIVINGGINSYKDYNNIVKNIPKRKNIKGFMIGREALKNPDCFVDVSNMLNCTLLHRRSLDKINSDFKKLCAEHVPRDIYLERIKLACPWYN